MPESLRPCPFCGGDSAAIKRWESCYAVVCKNPDCQAEGPWDLGESGAVEKWNERVQPPEVEALAQALGLIRSTLENGANPPSYRIRWALDIVAKALSPYEEPKDAATGD